MSLSTVRRPGLWYAVRTRSRHEKAVQQQFQQKQIESFFPTVTRVSHWQDRTKKIEWPLFPGYCFARIELPEVLPILRCVGVLTLVAFDGVPMPIPDQEIDSIRLLMASELHYDPCPLIHEGAFVEVVRGPLRGVMGQLLRKDAERATVVLAVNLTGHGVRVQIGADDVALLRPNPLS